MNRDWENEQGYRTKKTPTSLLLKPDLSFDSFGYKAEEKYCNLRNVSQEKEYWFFQHFKMCLHNDEVSVFETVTFWSISNRKRTRHRKKKQAFGKPKELPHSYFLVSSVDNNYIH